ncbi:hypothetical protein B0J14DRAFT_704750 [Halenospora varia]|nr:hypothetical protein B0J14DRAFT_704750 [Halenospora varia]
MGSGSSRLETRWWEAEAQQKVITTTNIGKVEVICSLIPGLDGTTMIGHLKAHPSDLTADVKANALWRVLQTPPGYSESPWNWNWQPPLKGVPSKIAADFHATVCCAIFRVPFFDFVKCALGYNTKAHFVRSLLHAACDVRDGLRTEFQDRPRTKDIYIEVEKALEQRHHPLAYWIVASSLYHTTYAPYDALASSLNLIQTIFAARKLDLVLQRLAALDRRFLHINQMYDWQKWSTDLDFWECVDQTLWSGRLTTPPVPPHLPEEDRDERSRFLEGFETVAEDGARSTWSKVMSSMKRLIMGPGRSDSLQLSR